MESTLIIEVMLSKRAKRDLEKVPDHIQRKLKLWIALVERQGIVATRLIKGFHDEPLKGIRTGQRSIRLSKSYRAIYFLRGNSELEFVTIEEIHKHDY